ncbi:MAG: 3-hydroxybutyrate dehydrogenase [Alphaproteobacteria bacterium]|nr:3-hydroxybutyrate dehydrogenase [Alphaproteobacteria bacterium]
MSKTALITGSTSGIGAGIAESFARQKYNIILNGFGNIADIEAQQKYLTDTYAIKTLYSACDLSKADQIDEMIKTAKSSFGCIDVLVNNAGIQYTEKIEDFPPEKWDAIIAINLTSAFHTIRHTIPIMKEKGWGRIINIASAHGLVASKNKSAYVASKHGIIGLTKVIALETATVNITCNAICPGWVDTPLMRKQVDDKAKTLGVSFDQALLDMVSEKQPSQKCATPHDIGELCVFLAREEAAQITGASYSIDGGWTTE